VHDDEQRRAVELNGDFPVESKLAVLPDGHQCAEEDGWKQNEDHADEEAEPERGPRRLLVLEGRHTQALHGFLTVAALQMLREQILHVGDQRVDFFGQIERRGLHVGLVPLGAAVGLEYLVVFLEDLAEAGVVEGLVVLEQDK